MNADVFISYATADRPFAERCCARLESEGLRCWMAPRDMVPGLDWSAVLVMAIDTVRAVIVVISNETSRSKHVPREVEQADRKGKTIIPVYVEECALGGTLAYYLEGLHAIRGGAESQGLEDLSKTMRAVLHGISAAAPLPAGRQGTVEDEDLVALARGVCRNVREELTAIATVEDAITISEVVHGKQVKFIDLACNRSARQALSQWEARHGPCVCLVGEDLNEAFPPRTDLPVVCVLDSLDGTQHWLRRKNLYCTALSIFVKARGSGEPYRLRVSAVQLPEGTLLVAREDSQAAFVDGRPDPLRLSSAPTEKMASAHVCTVSRRPDQYRLLVRHLAAGSPFSGLYTFGGNPGLADLTLGRYDAVFQPDASSIQDDQPIWDWLPGGHILWRSGGYILGLDGADLDVLQAAELSMNTGGGRFPYVAATNRILATAIVQWLNHPGSG